MDARRTDGKHAALVRLMDRSMDRLSRICCVDVYLVGSEWMPWCRLGRREPMCFGRRALGAVLVKKFVFLVVLKEEN